MISCRVSENKASIHEIMDIRDLITYVRRDSIVLVDLDNTIMESVSEFGGDQWFVAFIKYAIEANIEKNEAISLVVALYNAVQRYVKVKAVQNVTPMIIDFLQKAGVTVLGITARGSCLISSTERQLKQVGVNFLRKEVPDQSVFFAFNQLEQAAYHQGVLYCADYDKGECFAAYLQWQGIQPEHIKHVIMVDDKLSNVIKMSDKLCELGIEFDGLRYGYLDEKVFKFRLEKLSHYLYYLHALGCIGADLWKKLEEKALLPLHTESWLEKDLSSGIYLYPPDKNTFCSAPFFPVIKASQEKNDEDVVNLSLRHK